MRHTEFMHKGLQRLTSRLAHIAVKAVVTIAVSIIIGNAVGQETSPQVRQTALSTADALSAFEIAPGFEIELAACEPQVIDPVTARFDSAGRLWVVEMKDYPKLPENGSASGRIKVLTDADGDGFFEEDRIFIGGLVFPTGLQPFRDGVIVTHSDKVSYFADTNGDQICDHQEDWFTGFSSGNEQLRANHPTWLMENVIHVASGLRGGEIVPLDNRWNKGAKPLSLATRDFQFSPFGDTWRAVAGNSQFGFHQDAGMRQYVCSNRNPCDLILAEPFQVRHNPMLPLASWTFHVMPIAENSQVYPLANSWTTSNLHAGQFTAACGVFRYESDLLSPWLYKDFFACEPTGSLVQRYRTNAEGIVPRTVRAHENSEFLASRDAWFRPVDFFDGPDGAMYIVDMHRAVIEHPDWMPEELKKRKDMRWGDDAGRIYRLVPANKQTTANTSDDFRNRSEITSKYFYPSLGLSHAISAARSMGEKQNAEVISERFLTDANQVELVQRLFHPNRWSRTTASRLIAEQLADDVIVGPKNLGDGQSVRSNLGRLLSAAFSAELANPQPSSSGLSSALWLLEFGKSLDSSHLRKAARTTDPATRCQVIRLLARRTALEGRNDDDDKTAEERELARLREYLANDGDPRVRFQWLIEFAENATTNDIELITNLVKASIEDSDQDREWIGRALSLLPANIATLTAVQMISIHQIDDALMLPLSKRLGWESQTEFLHHLLMSERFNANSNANSADDRTANRNSIRHSYVDGMLVRGLKWNAIKSKLSPAAQQRLDHWIEDDRETATNSQTDLERRKEALTRLAADISQPTLDVCRTLLTPDLPELFPYVLRVAEKQNDLALPVELLGTASKLPPNAVSSLLQAFLRNPNWTPVLLDGIESGVVPVNLLDPASRSRLSRHPVAEISKRFNSLVSSQSKPERERLLQRYREAMTEPADLQRGKHLFGKCCAACHRIADVGHFVGPDISDLRTQTPDQILLAILDPNAAIDAAYFRYSVLTSEGYVIEGLLVDSQADSVTIRLQEGEVRTIERKSIESFKTTGISMMPEGFESQLTPAEMKDLIGYLKRWRFAAAEIPLDPMQPAVR